MGVNHPFIAPTTCRAYTIAIPLHDYCAVYNPSQRPPLCMPYTIQYWHWLYRVKAKSGCKLPCSMEIHRGFRPLQESLSLLGFCARISHPFIAPPTCGLTPRVRVRVNPFGLTLQYYSSTIARFSTPFRTPPRFHAIHHTILCIAISCKG